MKAPFLILLLAAVFGTARGATTNLSLQVIPQPREVKAAGAGFAGTAARFILVSDNADDRFAARELRNAVRETHGVDCDIVLLPQKSTNSHRLCLSTTTNLPAASSSPREKEGYGLVVNPTGAQIEAEGDAGLFYGVQTLIQLLEQSSREEVVIPGIIITDWPTFGLRTRYFDGSQYQNSVVITRANLENEIKTLSRFKLNVLCFDAYQLVPFKSFPACADRNTLCLADWDYLVELANRHHVILMPSLQSLAQTYEIIWKCDEGKPYREETAPGLICPSRPESIKFLQGLYRDLISVFKYSPILGIGCSEVGMQWQEHYCPRCKERIAKGETLADIYYKHVRNCAEAVDAAAKEAGRPVRPMMWADEFYMGYGGKRWVGIENVPTNMVMGHWKYWKDYDTISGLLERGFDVFFLSATYQHNAYLVDLSPEDPADGKWPPLLDSGIRNITDQAQRAAADNQKGLRGKVLGGGCATFSQHDIRCWDTTWFAYALQAEYSWGDCQRPPGQELNRFTDNFAAIFYGARDPQAAAIIATAYRDLDAAKSDLERNNYLIRDFIGIYDVQDVCYTGNDLEASLKLIDELAAHAKGPGKSVADVRQRCNHAVNVAASLRQKLASIVPRVQNPESLQHLISAAHKIENHARRTLLLLAMQEAFQSRPVPDEQFSKLHMECQELEADTRLIADEMDELTWGADAAGYHKVLASLATFEKRLRDAAQSLPRDEKNK